MPRILYLSHRIPYPPNRGDRIRSFHWLKYLAERAEVHLAFLAQEPVSDDSLQALRQVCTRVGFSQLHRRGRWVNGAWSLVAGKTATEGLFRSSALKRMVSDWSREIRYDAVVVFCSSVAQYLNVSGLAGVPTVVDLVDVDSQKFFDYANASRGPKRQLYRWEGERLRRLETSLADRADSVTLVSRAEVDVFRQFCRSERVAAVCNGVDFAYFSAPSPPTRPSDSLSCVFVGALDYKANLDGVAWFCERVWPDVRKDFPQAEFRLVGSRPGASAGRLGRLPGVRLVGEVPDVRPHLWEAAVVVAPLQVARGIQNKVLEAFAMGKAVVATPEAREGIDASAGVHLLEASNPVEWRTAIGTLFKDPARRSQMGRAARTLIEENYAWSRQLGKLAALPGLEHCLTTTRNSSAGNVRRGNVELGQAAHRASEGVGR